jgi:hypothetical protein
VKAECLGYNRDEYDILVLVLMARRQLLWLVRGQLIVDEVRVDMFWLEPCAERSRCCVKAMIVPMGETGGIMISSEARVRPARLAGSRIGERSSKG